MAQRTMPLFAAQQRWKLDWPPNGGGDVRLAPAQSDHGFRLAVGDHASAGR
jgi:hypothetical protein